MGGFLALLQKRDCTLELFYGGIIIRIWGREEAEWQPMGRQDSIVRIHNIEVYHFEQSLSVMWKR